MNNGEVVLAQLSRGKPFPYTYANRTQAQNRADTVGGEVIQRGRPFFVRMPSMGCPFTSTKATDVKVGDTIIFDLPGHDVTIENVSTCECGWSHLAANNDTYSIYLKPTDTIRVLSPESKL